MQPKRSRTLMIISLFLIVLLYVPNVAEAKLRIQFLITNHSKWREKVGCEQTDRGLCTVIRIWTDNINGEKMLPPNQVVIGADLDIDVKNNMVQMSWTPRSREDLVGAGVLHTNEIRLPEVMIRDILTSNGLSAILIPEQVGKVTKDGMNGVAIQLKIRCIIKK